MAKKNMGKVKRYRRSFYSPRQRVLRILGPIAILAVLFVAGWLVGPAVIDFGTSTWYSITRGDDSASASTSQPQSAASQPEGQGGAAASEPESQPQPTAQPAAGMDGSSWAFVNTADVADAASAQARAGELAAQGVTHVVIPLKDASGSVYYASALEAAAGSLSSAPIDAEAAAQAMKDQGIVPVAGICAFQDPLAAGANRSMAVAYQGTDYLWLDAARDNGGKPWLNPYSTQAVGYISGLIDEAIAMGFEQIWLSGVQFPTTAGRDMASYGDTAGVSESQCLANALAQWQQKADCWVEYPLNVASGQETRLTGGTIDALGIRNLAVRVSGEITEETQAQLDAAQAAASGCDYLAVVSGDTFTAQAVEG